MQTLWWVQNLNLRHIYFINFFFEKIKKGIKKRMSKSRKSEYFRHIFSNNFILVYLQKIFTTDLKSSWNSAFFGTFFNLKKI